MNIKDDLVARDLKVLWHPCSQMKDYETFDPLHVVKAKGAYFILNNGTKVLDAISSWWCKNLGHAHPRLLKALRKQSEQFEHVILANTTNEPIVELSERLTSLTHSLNKIFYASDGSCAVEIALKMAVLARQVNGQTDKNKIMALANGYHGETLFAMAVSDLGLYQNGYESFLPKINFIENIPYVCCKNDELWRDCAEIWNKTEVILNQKKSTLSAIILEPIVQGAAGMKIYSQDFLKRLRTWCTHNDVYLICDEIMTGFGRTGEMFAYQHANIEPDFVCLGKGMTGGVLPMSAVLTSNQIYDLFYDDYVKNKSFLHSHTFTGNALAAAVAIECLKIMEDENILLQVHALEPKLQSFMHEVAEKTQKLVNIRSIGGIVAADLVPNDQDRLGYHVFRHAVKHGALLRPLGNTIYWFPPLNIKPSDLKKLRDITIRSLNELPPLPQSGRGLGRGPSLQHHAK